MGKTNKKRKFTSKVSRKPKKPIPKFVYPQQPELQQLWDAKKTLRQNFQAIGLAVDPNSSKALKPKVKGIQPGDRILGAPEEAEDQEESHLLQVPEAKPPIEKRISRAKIDYFMPLIRKYGTDYQKMFRDIKLNYEQHTAQQLKKGCEWLIEKLAQQEAALVAAEKAAKKRKAEGGDVELPEDFPELPNPDDQGEADENKEEEEEEEGNSEQ